MSTIQDTNEEFNVFYYGLKNNFKTTSKIKSYESEEFEFYSESVKLNIDSYYESIFGQRFNSSLFDYYKQVYFEVKDEDEKNFKIISLVIDNFYNTLSHYYTEITESRYFYFLKPLSIEKKLGFQEKDVKFKNFIIKLILQEIRFEDGNFILLDKTYGTIINALIAECVQNIRREMIQNTIDLDYNDLINDINKLELEKNRGSFDFLNTSVNLLRILKADMNDQYEGSNLNVKPDIHPKITNNIEKNYFFDYSKKTESTINQEIIDIKLYELTENNQYFDNRQETNINVHNQLTKNTHNNLTEQNQYNDNREITNINTVNHFTEINNTTYNLNTNNNDYTKQQNKKRNLLKNESEKKEVNQKIIIKFSPFKFKNLLIRFFKNAGIQIDTDKENKIDRFILNSIEVKNKNYTGFSGSSSATTINFFDKKEVTILKFCALLLLLINEDKIESIPDETLQNILITQLKEINEKRIGISTDLRNQIRKNLHGLTNEKLAKHAGFKNSQEIIGLIKH